METKNKSITKKTVTAALSLTLAFGAVASLGACKQEAAEFDENKNISVVVREDGSGTKSAFMELLGLKGKADVSGAIVATGTTAVLQEVKGNSFAIAYDSLGFVTDEVKKLKVDGVAPTVDNIKSGSYKISRPLNVVYQAENVASGVNAAFLSYLRSAQAQTIISSKGYVSTKDNAVQYVADTSLEGEINISGSTSLKPLMEFLAEEFETLQQNVTVNVAGGGSGTGYNDGNTGVSDFGMISEVFNESKASNCTYYEVAKDGIAVIINKSNPLDSISLADLKNIFDVDAGDNAIKTWAKISK